MRRDCEEPRRDFYAVRGRFIPCAFVIILIEQHGRESIASSIFCYKCSDFIITYFDACPPPDDSLSESSASPGLLAILSSPHKALWKRRSLVSTIPALTLSRFYLQSTVCISVEPRRIPVPCPSTLGFLGSTTEKATNQYRGSFLALDHSASPRNEAFWQKIRSACEASMPSMA